MRLPSLHDAAAKGEIGRVRACLHEESTPPDALCETAHTALFFACSGGHSNVAKVLLAAGANVNLRCGLDQITPVYGACQSGHLGLMRELIAAGADLSIRTGSGSPLLHYVVDFGYAEIVRELIKSFGMDVNARNRRGHTPLILSTQHHRPEAQAEIGERRHAFLVRILCEAGADTEVTMGELGGTPLMLAVQSGHLLVVQELLRAGADPMVARADGGTPLLCASQKGYVDVLCELLKAGADTEKAYDLGFTPLILASECGQVEIIRELLKAGADSTAKTSDGLTGLLMASENGHSGAVRELLRGGASLTEPTPEGHTPLILAAQGDHVEVTRQLVKAGAPTSGTANFGYSPLLTAVECGNVEVVRELLRAGVDVSAEPRDGETSLLTATRSNRPDIVRELLRYGANPRQSEDDVGAYTPLHYAADLVYEDVARTLLEWGALETAKDINGDTPACVVGIIPHEGDHIINLSTKANMQRLLARGPAFRAHSWLWPIAGVKDDTEEKVPGLPLLASSASTPGVHNNFLLVVASALRPPKNVKCSPKNITSILCRRVV